MFLSLSGNKVLIFLVFQTMEKSVDSPVYCSEPAKHLKGNPGHKFSWKILCNAPNHQSKRKILEALHISKFKPGLNDQIKSTRLKLFPNGVT